MPASARSRRAVALLLVALSGLAALALRPPTAAGAAPGGLRVGAAGVPGYIGAAPDYDRMFRDLRRAGITSFFPLFQYRELPTFLTYGHERDFLPPCTRRSPALRAMRRHGVRLIVPASLLYPDGAPASPDPLRALVRCLGRAGIDSVYSVDEPAATERDVRRVRAIYRRVKAVDPTIPVVMVQAPLTIRPDAEGWLVPPAPAEVRAYFRRVARFNRYADVVGFDLYPIAGIPFLVTPERPGVQRDVRVILGDHLRWLRRQRPRAPRVLVLQAFSYRWQGDPTAPDIVPTRAEVRTMACAARRGGAAQVIWYGQGFQATRAQRLWDDVRAVSAAIVRAPGRTCRSVA